MEADTGFRAHGPFQQMLVLVRMNSTGNQYKHFTETRAKEVYKCIKLIPPYEQNKQRDLHEFNQQHEQSVLHLTNSTGETMPSKGALCRLDDDKNPIHTYTETVVNGQSVFDELQVKGKRVLLEENYYNVAQHAYDALADNDNTFLDRTTKSKIQKIQTFLTQQQYQFNAELLLYLDTNHSPPVLEANPSPVANPSSVAGQFCPNDLVAQRSMAPTGVIPVTGLDGNFLAGIAANAPAITLVNVQPGATNNNIGVQNNNDPTNAGTGQNTPPWAKRFEEEQQRQGAVQQVRGEQVGEMHASTVAKQAPPPSAGRYKPKAHDAHDLASAFESDAFEAKVSTPQRQPATRGGILQTFVRHALDEANLQANIKYYTEHSPDRRNRSEVLYAARLAKVSIILSAIEGNSNFVDKQLSGLAQLPMPIGDILSQSWSGLAKQLSRQLYFFGAGNRVLVYDEGALMEKEGNNELVPLVLPVAGFAHQATITLFDPYETQFTVMWFEDSSEDAATVLSSLIQLALASQCHHETPHLVEVDVTSEGNNPTAIVLSSDHLSQLCKLSEEDPTDHSIEFKKAVLTSHQQSGILKTAGQIILTDCIFRDDGQEIVQELMLGARDLVLYELTLRGNLSFGIEQCLQLIESCNKTIVIGSGAATEFFEQAHLVDRLKDKAAIDGIYYSWKFDATDYSSFEMEQLGEFLVDIYSRKLLWSVDSTAFAVAKAQILERLSNAYDQHDPDGETFEWPCDLVDILPRTQNQESLANDVKEHLEPLVFVEGHRPPAIPIPPRPDAETVPLSVYFASQMDAGKRKCILCATDIGIDDTQCEVCLCICMPGQVGTNCEACRKSNEANNGAIPEQNPVGVLDPAPNNEANDGAIPEQNPVGVLDPAPKNNEADDDTIPEQAKVVVGEGGFSIEATASSSAKVRNSIFSEAAPSSSTNDFSSGGGWSFTDAIESASNGDTPALVKETEPVVGEKKTEEPETKGVEPPQVQASKTPKIEPVVEEKKTDEPKTKGVEPPQVQASETPKIERKLQANDRVQVNDLVHAGSKRQHVGKHGTVQTLSGPWVYVKLDGEEELIAFYPVWLD